MSIEQLSSSEASGMADWRPIARCRDMDAADFFRDNDNVDMTFQQIKAAKMICGKCVVKYECLTWALDNNQRDGYWGDMPPIGRAVIQILGS